LKTRKHDKPLLYSVIEYSPLASWAKTKKKDVRIPSKAPFLLVGTARFELTTSRTPSDFRRFSQLIKTNQNALKSITCTDTRASKIRLDSRKCHHLATIFEKGFLTDSALVWRDYITSAFASNLFFLPNFVSLPVCHQRTRVSRPSTRRPRCRRNLDLRHSALRNFEKTFC